MAKHPQLVVHDGGLYFPAVSSLKEQIVVHGPARSLLKCVGGTLRHFSMAVINGPCLTAIQESGNAYCLVDCFIITTVCMSVGRDLSCEQSYFLAQQWQTKHDAAADLCLFVSCSLLSVWCVGALKFTEPLSLFTFCPSGIIDNPQQSRHRAYCVKIPLFLLNFHHYNCT